MPLLEADGLTTQFFTQEGVVKAVDGVSFFLCLRTASEQRAAGQRY